MPAVKHREIVVWPGEYACLLSVVQGEHLRDLIVVTWETGCRPQESLRVEGRHVDRVNKRWLFPKSESKNRKLSRGVYLTDTAFAITQRRMAASPTGPPSRNSLGRPWMTEAVNCGFKRMRAKLGMRKLQGDHFELEVAETQAFAATLQVQRTKCGRTRNKSERELLGEARRKLLQRRASRLVPNYSLYALRHSSAVARPLGFKSTSAQLRERLSVEANRLIERGVLTDRDGILAEPEPTGPPTIKLYGIRDGASAKVAMTLATGTQVLVCIDDASRWTAEIWVPHQTRPVVKLCEMTAGQSLQRVPKFGRLMTLFE